MKRSVGAFASCASSTSRTTRAMVLSAAAAVTRTLSTPSALIVPAKTASPTPLRFGVLSPVTGASSMSLEPSVISPSAGMRSPGRTTMTSPTASCSAGTSAVPPFRSTSAIFGTRSASPCMLARARPAATPSSNSPIRNRTTTAAASSVAPISTAPTAAMVISVSTENGVPANAAISARRAIGTRPTSSAARNSQRSAAGKAWPAT